MPRYLLGVLLLLLVSVSEMQAQGDVVLYIEGKPVYRSEFEYYYRKAPEQTPEAYLPAFINYKLKVRYAMDSGLETPAAEPAKAEPKRLLFAGNFRFMKVVW